MFKEFSKYLIFGFLTTVISFCSFTLMSEVVHTGVTVSNAISWILAVLFAFVTNKTIVFQNKDKTSILRKWELTLKLKPLLTD